MAFITSEYGAAVPSRSGAAKTGLAGLLNSFRIYRQRRAIYLRTLRELQSYRPHELHDLRVQSADFEELARKQAGW